MIYSKNSPRRHKFTYTVWNGGQSATFPRPEILPMPGQTLVVRKLFSTPAMHVYHLYDELELVRRTASAPHGSVSSLGNWVVKDLYLESVWTNIEMMIAEGIVEIKR